MKKVIFGLLLLVGSVLFLINHLADITSKSTDKVSNNALNQLIATGNKPVQNQPPTDKQSTIAEQVANTVTPLIQQVTDTALAPLNKTPPDSKTPIATIKIHDKNTAKGITIEAQGMLEAQQQEEQKKKTEKFKAYYHKPERCDPPSTHEIRVACVNENMRARAKFEELYQQGKL